MERRQIRNLVFRIHTWLGLHLCLLLALIFASGTLLIFSPELNRYDRSDLWVSPAPAGTPKATTGQIFDSVRAQQGVEQIYGIDLQSRPWLGRTVYGRGPNGRLVAQVNAHTAEFMGFGGESTLRRTIRALHDTLLIPLVDLAQLGVNFLSFFVLAMVLTGLITYRRFWKGYLRLPQRDADHRTRKGALHRLLGVWVAPFLIASALASSVFFLNSVGWKPVYATAETVPERTDKLPEGFNGAVLDGLTAECRTLLPEFVDARVDFPRNNRQEIRILGYDATIGEILGGVTCHADASGAIPVQITRASDGNAMVNIKALAIAVHYGTWGGWVSLALWLLGGIGSVFLTVTGAQVYASRIRKSQESQPKSNGTLSLLISGLGIFKWGYLALVLGVSASVIAKALL